jgi:hypothetical protein
MKNQTESRIASLLVALVLLLGGCQGPKEPSNSGTILVDRSPDARRQTGTVPITLVDIKPTVTGSQMTWHIGVLARGQPGTVPFKILRFGPEVSGAPKVSLEVGLNGNDGSVVGDGIGVVNVTPLGDPATAEFSYGVLEIIAKPMTISSSVSVSCVVEAIFQSEEADGTTVYVSTSRFGVLSFQ